MLLTSEFKDIWFIIFWDCIWFGIFVIRGEYNELVLILFDIFCGGGCGDVLLILLILLI